ncbi:peptidyl-prolyl cis-trans isomerase [Kineosporia sp. NBRC 101677]|nr:MULTISPECIES: bacterial proteasome activator family protein [Kineosporia]GLY19148.1 peptidyl-prolyl cis-trans isomerase [Kineosporia sp. NBRC 101677]
MTSQPHPSATTGDVTDISDSSQEAGADGVAERVVVVTPEGMAVTGPSDSETNPANQIEQPAKVMRIGSMIKQLLEEVRNAPLDEAGRARLAAIHERSLKELEDGLAPELVEELHSIVLPFSSDTVPTDAELRIAQAQLVGWLEGLFHGIQTVLFAQQMAARTQLEQMRRALPGSPGGGLPQGAEGLAGQPQARPGGTGQYL